MIFLEWEGIEDDFDEDFCSIVLMKNYVTKNAKKHVFYTIFTSISPRFCGKEFFKGKNFGKSVLSQVKVFGD